MKCTECSKMIENPHGNTKFCKECASKRRKQDRLDYINSLKGHLNKLLNKKLRRKYERNNLTIEFLEYLFNKQNGLCAISGVPMTYYHTFDVGKGGCGYPTNVSIDRIDSNKGYETDNIQLVCYIANVMKSTLTETELLWWCNQILQTKGVH